MLKNVTFTIVFGALLFAQAAWAGPGGPFEVSSGFSFSSSKYSDKSSTWTRTFGFSFGLDVTPVTQLEAAYQNTTTRNKLQDYEDTQFNDQIYSVNLNQMLLPRGSMIQPYGKVGIGQLNRDASGSYANGVSPGARTDSVTVLIGAGVRVYLIHNFGIRGELTSYLTGGHISSYRDNVNATAGFSYSF